MSLTHFASFFDCFRDKLTKFFQLDSFTLKGCPKAD